MSQIGFFLFEGGIISLQTFVFSYLIKVYFEENFYHSNVPYKACEISLRKTPQCGCGDLHFTVFVFHEEYQIANLKARKTQALF